MVCTLDDPCGAAAFPDLAFNRDMQLYGLPQRRYRCLAGHSVIVGLPEGLAEQVTSEPESRKRSRKRSKKPKEPTMPAVSPAIDLNPADLPPGVGFPIAL